MVKIEELNMDAQSFSIAMAKLKKSQNIQLVFVGGKDIKNNNFQEAVSTIFVLAQFFGVLPIINMKDKTAAKLRFKWRAFRTFWSAAIFLLISCFMCIDIYMAYLKPDFQRVINAVFYASVAAGMVIFGSLARKWPTLMLKWEEMEAKFPKYQTQKERKQLSNRINLFAIGFLVCGIIEHIMTLFLAAYYTRVCKPNGNPVEEYFRSELYEVFHVLSYALWKAILFKFANVVAAFIWNYMSLFIIIVSIGISSRFKQLNTEMERVKGIISSEKYWELRRYQYRKLSTLCTQVDDAICMITVVSLANNLFFICVQLLKSISPMPSTYHAIYFWYSLIFFIIRTLIVSLAASSIHDESRKPIDVLRAVPAYSWCTEVNRFVEEVVNNTVALSGMKFFYLTRGIIMSVAGTIVTYELVLLQFETETEQQMVC